MHCTTEYNVRRTYHETTPSKQLNSSENACSKDCVNIVIQLSVFRLLIIVSYVSINISHIAFTSTL